jgi:5-methylcytosine-specific restriction endonuclease McrA
VSKYQQLTWEEVANGSRPAVAPQRLEAYSGRRLFASPEERTAFATIFAERWMAGESVPSLAAAAGVATGTMHNLVREGGAHRKCLECGERTGALNKKFCARHDVVYQHAITSQRKAARSEPCPTCGHVAAPSARRGRPPASRDRRYSSGRWQRLRAITLERDRWECQVVPGCTERATVADHIVPTSLNMPDDLFFSLDNLRAACRRHNLARAFAAHLTVLPDREDAA